MPIRIAVAKTDQDGLFRDAAKAKVMDAFIRGHDMTPNQTIHLLFSGNPSKFTIHDDTILYYTILYYTILYYTILYYTILYYTILYYTILYYTILYYTILYYTILYYTILYYTILYYTTLHYTTLHYTTLHYTTLHYTTLHYTTLHYTTLHYTTLYYTILYYTILYYTILYYTILYYTILYYTILYYTTLHYTTLHYTTLHYTTLHYTTLHYTILYYTILYYTILYIFIRSFMDAFGIFITVQVMNMCKEICPRRLRVGKTAWTGYMSKNMNPGVGNEHIRIPWTSISDCPRPFIGTPDWHLCWCRLFFFIGPLNIKNNVFLRHTILKDLCPSFMFMSRSHLSYLDLLQVCI